VERAADRYEVEVVPIQGWRAWRNAALALVFSAGGPAGPASTLMVRVVERGTGRVVYLDKESHPESSAVYMRDALQEDLDSMSPEEFVQTWGSAR
jgi:hypothetical protein